MRLAIRSPLLVVLAAVVGVACDSPTTTSAPAVRVTLALPHALVAHSGTIAAQTISTTNNNGNDSEVVAIRVRISVAGDARTLLDKKFDAEAVCIDSSVPGTSDTSVDDTACVLPVQFTYAAGSERATFEVTVEAMNSNSVVYYRMGPTQFQLSADAAAATVTATAAYVGPGNDATGVVLSPRSVSVAAGAFANVSCSPTRGGVVSSAFAPMRVSTANSAVAVAFFGTLIGGSSSTGIQVVGVGSGTTRLTCELDFGTHAQDAIDVTVTGGIAPTGLQLQLVSGGGQSGNVNTTLPIPIVVRVVNAQGQPVSGVVVVTGLAPVLSGTVSPVQGVTSVSGIFSTTWTLGTFVGTQSLAFAAPGAPGIIVTAVGR